MTRFLRGLLLPAILAGVCLASPARAQMSESELVMRLNRLENQVRQLTGQVEQLQYRNQQLEQQLGRPAGAPQTVPARPSAAQPQYAPPPQSYPQQQSYPAPQSYPQQSYPPRSYPQQPIVEPELEPAPPPRGGRRGDAFDPNQNPNAPGVPRALGAPGTVAAAPPLGVTASDEPPYVGAPGGRQAGDPLDLGIKPEEAANAPPPR